jgi:hypothetical protein
MTRFTKVPSVGTVAGAALFLSLLQCTHASDPQETTSTKPEPPPEPQPRPKPEPEPDDSVIHHQSLIKCSKPGDCPIYQPACQLGSLTPSCQYGYCQYTVQLPSNCVAPDVEICDPTDGGRPLCSPTSMTYGPLATCGIRECANGTNCTWGPCMAIADAGH